jgi:hypothetical protein
MARKSSTMSSAMKTGWADELPLGEIKILFAPANSALGSSFETLCPVCLLRIFGQALRPNNVVINTSLQNLLSTMAIWIGRASLGQFYRMAA